MGGSKGARRRAHVFDIENRLHAITIYFYYTPSCPMQMHFLI